MVVAKIVFMLTNLFSECKKNSLVLLHVLTLYHVRRWIDKFYAMAKTGLLLMFVV